MNLSIGSRGDAVKAVQSLLIEAGYSVGSSGVDGQFGQDTQAAIEQFQTDHGLTADGVVGPDTAVALGLDLSTGQATASEQQAPASDGSGTPTAQPSTSSKAPLYGATALGGWLLWRWLRG